MRIIIFLLLFAMQLPILGEDIKCCYIKDREAHRKNKFVLQTIIEEELFLSQNSDRAAHLMNNIHKIAAKMVQRGFIADAYAAGDPSPNAFLSFTTFALWEGRSELALTFFVYVWPSEEVALKYQPADSSDHLYVTRIHSHPISCAFSVLRGSLIQNKYKIVDPDKKTVEWIQEETLEQGQGDIDRLEETFIHQVYNRNSLHPCVSLHVYGLGSAKEVRDLFRLSAPEYTYSLQ